MPYRDLEFKVEEYHKLRMRKYHQTHREQEKQYRSKHRKRHNKQNRNWRKNHPDYIRNWRKNHPEQCKKLRKIWKKTHPEKEKEHWGKINHKRRSLGFVPLNKPFAGSEAHHIDFELVVYIPKELHKSIPHCIFTGSRMTEINDKVFEWLDLN